jgi:membrane protease YdiL (CAAX protease family)
MKVAGIKYGLSKLAAMGVALSLLASCAVPKRTARLEPSAPPTDIEEQARERLDDPACSASWSWLFPGVGQLCMGKTGEGAALTALTASEIGAAVAVAQLEVAGEEDRPLAPETLPLVGLQNLWAYSVADIYLERQRAEGQLYTPQDTLGELVAAPFNIEVLKEPQVWGGILGLTAAAFAFTALMSGSAQPSEEPVDRSPSYFGQDMPAGAAYSLSAATGTVLFSHVAIGEETLFRGVLQSGLARHHGEWKGWAWSSAIFGAFHIPNALVMPADQRKDYLLYSIPFITVVGSYMGLSYKWSDYSLASPVALHFWYNFLLSAAQYANSPGDSPVGMSVTIPF